VPLVKKVLSQFISANSLCCKFCSSQWHSRARRGIQCHWKQSACHTVAARRQGGQYYPCRKTLTVSETLVVRRNVVQLCIPGFSSVSTVSKINHVYKRSVLCNTEIRWKNFENLFLIPLFVFFSRFCLCFLLTHTSTGTLYHLHRKF